MRALRTSTNSSTTNGHYTMYEHFGFVSLIFKTSLIPDALSYMLKPTLPFTKLTNSI